MSLKKLITIKFVITIVAYALLAYFGAEISNSYTKLEKRNKVLLEQKEIYERIIKLENKDSEGKEKLYDIIKIRDSKYESESKKDSSYNIKTNILIFIILLIIVFNVFNFLNTKIEKLKSEESDSEKEKML